MWSKPWNEYRKDAVVDSFHVIFKGEREREFSVRIKWKQWLQQNVFSNVSNSRSSFSPSHFLLFYSSLFPFSLLSITSSNQFSFSNHSSESTSTRSLPIRCSSSLTTTPVAQTIVGLVQLIILYRDESKKEIEENEEESDISVLLEVRIVSWVRVGSKNVLKKLFFHFSSVVKWVPFIPLSLSLYSSLFLPSFLIMNTMVRAVLGTCVRYCIQFLSDVWNSQENDG